MLTKELEIELRNTETGTPIQFKVKKMTIANKCNLDQWVRMQYVHQALRDGIELKEAEKEAEYLDIIDNCWFLSEQRRKARVLYELINPSIAFREFEELFFSVRFETMTKESGTDGETEFSPQVQHLRYNNEMFVTAFRFAATNPTAPPPESKAEVKAGECQQETGRESTQG